jgi:magnesium chelatase family protein
VRERVAAALDAQLRRAGRPNAKLDNREIERDCPLSAAQAELLRRAIERLGLSARAMYRVLKVTRTIADLAGADAPRDEHLGEALSYRPPGRMPR